MLSRTAVYSCIAALLTACGAAPPTGAPVGAGPTLDRAEFNRRAAHLDLPLFWVADANGDGALDAEELAVTWGQGADWSTWVKDGALTPAFAEAWGQLAAEPATPSDPAEAARRAKMRHELDQGRRTLVLTDLRDATPADRAVAGHIAAAAEIIERLHARQNGVWGMDAKIAPDDPASRAMFRRNQGPWCTSPANEADLSCVAVMPAPPKRSGLYPAALQSDPKFCEALGKREDRLTLMSPFVAVQADEGGALSAVPYTTVFADDMQAVAGELRKAADALGADEAAFKRYLGAAAQAFTDNQWEPADEAWAAMNVHNSKWYLRVAPDETYFEPCAEKAGFHMSFARINQGSLEWQRKLDPLKQEMEQALADLAGPPYAARTVSFHLPDFIDIVLNAGDSRSAFGATIGQSLPNWGPVANEGRGRTVAMTNLYKDPDSKDSLRTRVESIFCTESMSRYSDASGPGVMSTVLHEAAHNLGPSAEYKVDGKTDREIFGGPLAATLEEFKAQMASLYFANWLREKGAVTAEQAEQANAGDVVWAMGHIASGMYNAEGRAKPYSQLSAILVGALKEAGAVVWHGDRAAHNGTDMGCVELRYDAFPAVGVDLMRRAAQIKAKGDKAAAEALKKKFVDADGDFAALKAQITERWRRAPKASFVYGVRL